MAANTSKNLRNIVLLGHSGSGKTSVAEAMLYLSKTTDRLGNRSAGNTVCDYDPEEIKRGFSISSSLCHFIYHDKKVNILDTPGFLDFSGEAVSALRVGGSALIVIDARNGVEVGTELAWEYATAAGLPKAFFINKYDDPEAHFGRIFHDLTEKFGHAVCPILIPAKTPAAFINLIDLKKVVYDEKGNPSIGEITPEYMPIVEKYREKLYESIASTNEALMEKYFAGEKIEFDEAKAAILQGIMEGSIVPVYCGSATRLWGIETMTECITDFFPDPERNKKDFQMKDGEKIPALRFDEAGECALFVYKTAVDQYGKQSYFRVMRGQLNNGVTLKNARTGTEEKISHIYTAVGKKLIEVDSLCCGDLGILTKLTDTATNDTLYLGQEIAYAPIPLPKPFYSMAIKAEKKGDEDKVAQGIMRMLEEDKTLRLENNTETKQQILSGMGDMQLDVVISRLKSRGGVSASLYPPRIAYRETIRKSVQVEGKHKKQSGGHGQYGHVKITFKPGEADGLTFTTSVVGGSVPKNYFPAVEKGLDEAMQHGVLAGYPVVNLAADLYDGSYHDVDSNELSFKMAASLAYKEGLPKASPVLLEPVGDLTVTVPDAMVGDVMGDINSKRRGSVMGMEPTAEKKGYTTVTAEAPKSEMADYTIALRALTQGKGSYTFYFKRYDEVPANIAQKVIEDAKAHASEE